MIPCFETTKNTVYKIKYLIVRLVVLYFVKLAINSPFPSLLGLLLKLKARINVMRL